MTHTDEQVYVKWFCKEIVREWDNWEPFSRFQIEINKDGFDLLPTNWSGYVQLILCKRREIGKYGDTHYLKLWRPRVDNNRSANNPI